MIAVLRRFLILYIDDFHCQKFIKVCLGHIQEKHLKKIAILRIDLPRFWGSALFHKQMPIPVHTIFLIIWSLIRSSLSWHSPPQMIRSCLLAGVLPATFFIECFLPMRFLHWAIQFLFYSPQFFSLDWSHWYMFRLQQLRLLLGLFVWREEQSCSWSSEKWENQFPWEVKQYWLLLPWKVWWLACICL